MRKLTVWGVLLLSLAAACTKDPGPETPEEPKKYELKELGQMSLREKVGQLFNVRVESLVPGAIGSVTGGSDALTDFFRQYPCGGVTLFAANITYPYQTSAFTEYLHGLDNYPLICVDEEGGRVARIGKNPNFPVTRVGTMASVGATGDPQKAKEAGSTIGEYLFRYGFDIDLAPVSDVNTNPDNVVIGDRAFGSSPELVGSMVEAFLAGLKQQKVEGCLKHFPGHGDTSTDSHYGYAESLKTWEELSGCEMIPFRAGIAAGAKMIMTAHVCLPNVTGSSTPSTLSPMVLTEILRGRLGYQGIIITDSMEMGAITQQYTNEEATLLALEAGVDILLTPQDYPKAFDAVMKAVEDKRISVQMIDERVSRILALKKELLLSRGLLKQ